jgi:SPP1 gp7 family putative phage head morphogenesis protein
MKKTTKNKGIAPVVWPNAGIEAWYRVQLETLVDEMSADMLDGLRAAWRESPPTHGFGQDGALAAAVMFRAPDGRVLLLWRKDNEGWAFPAGGVEPSEDIEGAARREAAEETGWATGLPLKPVYVYQHGSVTCTTFLCNVIAPFAPFLNDEHTTWRWLPPDYALKFLALHPGVRATLTSAEATMAADAAPTTLLRRAMEKWGGLWTRKLENLSNTIAARFANKAFNATDRATENSFKKAGFTVKFKPTKASVEAYKAVVAENVGLIKSIPQQYLTGVQSSVWQSVMKGGDLATLTKDVRKRYGVTVRRAQLIARDQNNKAKAIIENVRRQEIGVKEADWMHSSAGKEPRPTHVAMNGKRYKLSKGMYDPDPRVQEHVYPGQLINCRCSSKAIIPGFE